MSKGYLSGAALAVLVAGAAQSASAAPVFAWIIQPANAACRTDLELTGKSGAIVPVTLISDGELVTLRFSKPDLPERAFLPIRIDQRPYSNLMLRTADPAVGELTLSPETLLALRRGETLQVAWLAEEPVAGSLAGSDHALPDLLTCGAQAAADSRARLAAESEAKAAAELAAREKALADARIEAVRAQAAAAEAERQRILEEAERQRAAADAERQRVAYEDERRARAEAEQERERAYQDALRRYGYDDPAARDVPPPQPWPPAPRYPYPRRY